MAAQGMSNREIAQALFVSTKAVEGQLSQAYAKLGIPGRRRLHNALGMADRRALDPTAPGRMTAPKL
jgi:DNA-binding NarL/FixJ family response regulator